VASWDTATTVTTAASRELMARATDGDGNTTDSAIVAVTVTDLTAPAVAMTVPSAEQTLSRASPISLTAQATDGRGVSIVHFLVDGVDVGSTSVAQPGNLYTVTWNPAGFADGTRVVAARATDVNGNVGQSGQVSFSLTP